MIFQNNVTAVLNIVNNFLGSFYWECTLKGNKVFIILLFVKVDIRSLLVSIGLIHH
jgi:hypothetical protein